MQILFVSGALFPFAAEKAEDFRIARLASALPLEDRGCEVSVVLPLHFGVPDSVRERMKKIRETTIPYGWRQSEAVLYRLREDGATYYLIGNDRYFGRRRTEGCFDDGERYAYFAHAVLHLLGNGIPVPQLAVACGWCGACFLATAKWSPACGRAFFRTAFLPGDVRRQGTFAPYTRWEVFDLGAAADAAKLDGNWNLLRAGMLAADVIFFSSPFEGEAMTRQATAVGLSGTVREVWSRIRYLPNGGEGGLSSSSLPFPYTPARVAEGKAKNRARLLEKYGLIDDPAAMTVAVTDELREDGTSLLLRALSVLLREDVRILFCGVGEEDCAARLWRAARRYPGRIRCLFSASPEERDLLLAGADLSLVLEKEGAKEKVRRALSFGTPVLTETLLSDGCVVPYGNDGANGFLFEGEEALPSAVLLAASVFARRGAYRKLFRAAARTPRDGWESSARILLRQIAEKEEDAIG